MANGDRFPRFPVQNISDILDRLKNTQFFSVFDCASRFHQNKTAFEDQPKTAFSTRYGHFQSERKPIGIKNAATTFQRLMDGVLSGLQGTE